MNILFHSWAFPPNGGGVGAYIANMSRALASCGHQVVVVTGRAPGLPAEETGPNIKILRVYDQSEIGSRRVLHLVLDAAREHAVELIEGADYLGDCARLLKVRQRPPVVIKVHSCNILKVLHESQVLRRWQRPMIQAALLRNWRQTRREKVSIVAADMLTAPSARILLELERQGVNLPGKKAVIANPIMPLDSGHQVEAAVPTLLMVSRLDIGKGIQYLPRIVSRLVRDFPGLRLEIAGGDAYARGLGSLKKWLVGQIGDLAQYVSFLGHLEQRELIAAYARAWVVIMPSRWDNFPTTLLEAMSLGKPAVASPHGGMPEMLQDTLCPTALPESPAFAAHIKRFLGDGQLRRAAGDSMRLKAASVYSPQEIVSRYLDFVTSGPVLK